MVIPTEYGGQGRTYLERFVVTEELLAAGAPVAAHWIADRQTGPSLLRYGTEEQKQAFLPGDRRGEMLLRDRHERAGLGLGPGQRPHPRRAGRRRLGA